MRTVRHIADPITDRIGTSTVLTAGDISRGVLYRSGTTIIGRKSASLGALHQAVHTNLASWFTGQVGNISSNTTMTANVLRAYPICLDVTRTADRIAFVVNSGDAGRLGRVGIYENASPNNLYPSALLVDGGEQDCSSSGGKITNISVVLEGGRIYWLAYVTNAGAGGALFANQNQFCPPLGGVAGSSPTSLATPATIYTVNFTYAALPQQFPAGATLASVSLISIALRLN